MPGPDPDWTLGKTKGIASPCSRGISSSFARFIFSPLSTCATLCFFRLRNNTTKTTAVKKTTPPMTPPTISATFELDDPSANALLWKLLDLLPLQVVFTTPFAGVLPMMRVLKNDHCPFLLNVSEARTRRNVKGTHESAAKTAFLLN